VARDGLLYCRSPRGERLCIPAAGSLRRSVLQELHATPLGGHFGRDKTLAVARRSVWWPGMAGDVVEYVRTSPSCLRVKADHLAPAGLLYPLPVPSRRGACISLDFLELTAARSGHDFLQVHIDLLTGRVWLVPTFKTATAETAARNYIGSVFRDVGLPDTLVSDRDTRFTSAFWTALHAALGSSLIFGSPHHHNTTSKVDRVNDEFFFPQHFSPFPHKRTPFPTPPLSFPIPPLSFSTPFIFLPTCHVHNRTLQNNPQCM